MFKLSSHKSLKQQRDGPGKPVVHAASVSNYFPVLLKRTMNPGTVKIWNFSQSFSYAEQTKMRRGEMSLFWILVLHLP